VTANDRPAKILVCCLLALGTAALFWPVLHFDYVNYDDPLYIINNQHIRTLSWQSLAWAFQNNYAHLWHPLTWISHIIDFHFYGLMNPGGHHATSLALHVFNSTLLFVILNRMTKALWPSAMVAALFAWHPLHVESVAWVSERKDVLSAFFWLLTMWAYVRFTEYDKNPGVGRKVFYALSLLFFALGLLAKPMLVTLPFVLLLMDWWPLQRLAGAAAARPISGSDSEAVTARQSLATPGFGIARLVLEKIPFLLLSAVASVMTLRAASGLIHPVAKYPVHLRLINAALTYLRYVEEMIWPRNLLPVYPPEPWWSRKELLLACAFLVAVTVTAIRLRKARPFWLFGWLWYLGILVPVIGLVEVGAPPRADHNTYLPAIGLFLIACWEFRDIAASWKHSRLILATVSAAVLGACLVASSRQIQYWRNPVTLFRHNLEVTPDNYIAHADFAAYLRDAIQLDAAKKECEIAINLAPKFAWSHDVLAGVYLYGGELEKSKKEFQTVLALEPIRMDAHAALGKIALLQNLPGEAAAQYALVMAADPTDPNAHCGMGQALTRQGKLEEGRAQFLEALRLAPKDAEAHYYLGVLLAEQHHTAEAMTEYRTASEIQPNRPDALNNLAWILATDPRPEFRNGAEAVQMATKASSLTGNRSPFFIGTLAAAYAEAGRFDEAVAAAENAVDWATKAGNTALAQRNRELLVLYQSHKPYRDAGPDAPAR
jgi:tetratricopeptide (TPR) repeat protein